MSEIGVADAFDARRAMAAEGLLATFNAAGVLSAADVHVALRLCALGDESSEEVALAVALATRAPRIGHVLVDLATIRDTAAVDTEDGSDLTELPWPEPAAWLELVAASPLLVPSDPELEPVAPLHLEESKLYLHRYWREEVQVADDLVAIAGAATADVDGALVDDGIARLFADEPDGRQAAAARAALSGGITVVAGGPGTGKTTTVARILALLFEQADAAGTRRPLVALAAPTGKAAARLQEAVGEEAAKIVAADGVRDALAELRATTLHKLLGWRPGSSSRFRHNRSDRLPHDVVIVDETSMVSLTLMARLLEAVRRDARLVLVGDPHQLRSIEAGAVLGDVVGPGEEKGVDGPLRNRVVVLNRVHRFRGTIATLAEAIHAGDPDQAVTELRSGARDVTWIEAESAGPASEELAPVREQAVAAATAVFQAAREGDAETALRHLAGFRILCAHRRGPDGVSRWTDTIEGWLGEHVRGFATAARWYVGRPLLVTENDYELQLANGDTGVVVQSSADDRVVAAFERSGEVTTFSPTRLGAVETVFAMTVHKGQGSQFHTAAVLLPAPESRILTRELLYTAVTRAQERLIVVGSEETVRAAVERPIARASGLRDRLWTSR